MGDCDVCVQALGRRGRFGTCFKAMSLPERRPETSSAAKIDAELLVPFWTRRASAALQALARYSGPSALARCPT